MLKALTWAGALVLALHGLVHLMGTTVYLKLGELEGMPYRTTLLDGRWDLGDGGIRVVGVLWAVAAVAFGHPLCKPDEIQDSSGTTPVGLTRRVRHSFIRSWL